MEQSEENGDERPRKRERAREVGLRSETLAPSTVSLRRLARFMIAAIFNRTNPFRNQNQISPTNFSSVVNYRNWIRI